MTDRATLKALLARVLAGAGPDRALDGALAEALQVGGNPWKHDGDGWISVHGFGCQAAMFTASLDAALKLVPDGWGWAISTTGDLVPCAYGHSPDRSFWVDDTKAATPARAVCAFALRARIWIALQISGGKDEPLGN